LKFKINDKVTVLNENIEGIVVSIKNSTVLVESNDGFSIEFSEDELIKIDDEMDFKVRITEGIHGAIKEKEANLRKQKSKLSSSKKSIPAMEVDLHIEKLVPTTRGLDNFDIINIQLDTAKRQLDFAIQKRIQRVIFIHGVGEGVLKSELETLFRRYEYLKYYEADLQKYGRGATEVYIPQNPK
jgi:dsDNA-specific endonuclease/ATPase MutS2